MLMNLLTFYEVDFYFVDKKFMLNEKWFFKIFFFICKKVWRCNWDSFGCDIELKVSHGIFMGFKRLTSAESALGVMLENNFDK